MAHKAMLERTCRRIENEDVKSLLREHADEMDDSIKSARAIHEELYSAEPGYRPLVTAKQQDAEDDAEAADTIEKALRVVTETVDHPEVRMLYPAGYDAAVEVLQDTGIDKLLEE